MKARIRPRLGAAGGLGTALLLTLAGCGSREQFEYAEVEGKVTLGGKPLCGVNVTFYPDTEGAAQLPYATGKTDDAGTYTLTAMTAKPGALVGRNRAVVSWPARERGGDPDKPPPRPPGPPIPVVYTVVTETPLIVEVKAGPRQTIDLPLQFGGP
jgi:hypothetical protein